MTQINFTHCVNVDVTGTEEEIKEYFNTILKGIIVKYFALVSPTKLTFLVDKSDWEIIKARVS